MKGPAPDSYRKFGSIRILRDGRVRYSAWTLPGLRYFCFATQGDSIEVERGSRVVLYLWAPRGRVASACFAYDLTCEQLRTLVSELRRAEHGLERWIVPGLEFSQVSTNWKNNPDTYAIIPELLESCRDLPVAEQWRRVRANVLANAEKTRARSNRSRVKRVR